MRLVGAIVIGIVAFGCATTSPAPIPSPAQVPQFADLVGNWADSSKNDGKIVLSFRSDSTFTRKVAMVGKFPMILLGRWRLAGDSLLVSDLDVRIGTRRVDHPDLAVQDVQSHIGDLNQRVKLDHRTLTMTELTGSRQHVYLRQE